MFCEHCGAELDSGCVFCGHCGGKVGTNADTYNNEAEAAQTPEAEVTAVPVENDGAYEEPVMQQNNENYYESSSSYEDPFSFSQPSSGEDPFSFSQPSSGEDPFSFSQPTSEADSFSFDQPSAHKEPAPERKPVSKDQPGFDYPVAYQEPKPEKNGLVIGLIAVIIVAVVAIAGAIVWFTSDGDKGGLFGGGSDDASQSDSADAPQNDFSDSEYENDGPADADEQGGMLVSGNTRILAAYDADAIFAPEKLYNDADYYICYDIAALYSESGGYGRGQIAQLDANDVVTVKGAMEGYNWVYVYCKELDIYGWIEPTAISPDPVGVTEVKSDVREVVYYEEYNCRNAVINVGAGHNLNLRTTPGSTDDSTIILLIPNGGSVRVIGASVTDAKWYYVCYNSFDYGELYGFMSGDYLKMD